MNNVNNNTNLNLVQTFDQLNNINANPIKAKSVKVKNIGFSLDQVKSLLHFKEAGKNSRFATSAENTTGIFKLDSKGNLTNAKRHRAFVCKAEDCGVNNLAIRQALLQAFKNDGADEAFLKEAGKTLGLNENFGVDEEQKQGVTGVENEVLLCSTPLERRTVKKLIADFQDSLEKKKSAQEIVKELGFEVMEKDSFAEQAGEPIGQNEQVNNIRPDDDSENNIDNDNEPLVLEDQKDEDDIVNNKSVGSDTEEIDPDTAVKKDEVKLDLGEEQVKKLTDQFSRSCQCTINNWYERELYVTNDTVFYQHVQNDCKQLEEPLTKFLNDVRTKKTTLIDGGKAFVKNVKNILFGGEINAYLADEEDKIKESFKKKVGEVLIEFAEQLGHEEIKDFIDKEIHFNDNEVKDNPVEREYQQQDQENNINNDEKTSVFFEQQKNEIVKEENNIEGSGGEQLAENKGKLATAINDFTKCLTEDITTAFVSNNDSVFDNAYLSIVEIDGNNWEHVAEGFAKDLENCENLEELITRYQVELCKDSYSYTTYDKDSVKQTSFKNFVKTRLSELAENLGYKKDDTKGPDLKSIEQNEPVKGIRPDEQKGEEVEGGNDIVNTKEIGSGTAVKKEAGVNLGEAHDKFVTGIVSGLNDLGSRVLSVNDAGDDARRRAFQLGFFVRSFENTVSSSRNYHVRLFGKIENDNNALKEFVAQIDKHIESNPFYEKLDDIAKDAVKKSKDDALKVLAKELKCEEQLKEILDSKK